MKKFTLFRFVFSVGILFALGVNAQNGPLAPVKQVNLSSIETQAMPGDYMAIDTGGNWNNLSIWKIWDYNANGWIRAKVTPDQALLLGISNDQNRIFLASNVTLRVTNSLQSMQFIVLGGKVILDGKDVKLYIMGDKTHLRQASFPYTTSINGATGILY